MISEKDSTIIKIKKLLALSHSPNENEAVAAAQKASELLMKYNLSLGDIRSSNETVFAREIIWTYKKAISWKGQLLAGVAFFNFCIAYEARFDEINASVLYGRQANVITGKLQWEYLADVVGKMAARSSFVGLSAKNAFKMGCASRIANRMQDILKAQQELGFPSHSEADSTSALVVQSLYRKMEEEKKQLTEELGNLPSKKPGTFSDRDAFVQGLRAGDSVGLSKQLMGA